ncbi:UNVERIFIED_CONTAM: undecaprenol kinase [Brevibacillus sp. OAP136]|uniref:diacylglycerol kinase n=1 Tax=Brevibacillus fluminis TaxID=511487 RepID=UPI002482E8D4|nr:diacylglycerol kinase [Brevibacillus fluminis]
MKERKGLYRFLCSLRFAWAGIRHAVMTQPNMRIHLFFTAAVLAGAWWLAIPRDDLLLLLLFIALVLSLELVNTAIEAAVDLVTTNRHPLAKAAKDAAAGAVLVAAAASVVAGIIVFGPPLYRKIAEWLM